MNERYREGMTTAVHGLPAPVADGAQNSIAFTQADGLDRLGVVGDRLVASAQLAFVDGISAALMVAAGVVAVTANRQVPLVANIRQQFLDGLINPTAAEWRRNALVV